MTVHRLNDGAPLQFQRCAALEKRRKLVELLPPAHGIAQLVDLLSKNASVMHALGGLWSPEQNTKKRTKSKQGLLLPAW
jgi:hypothetical protein